MLWFKKKKKKEKKTEEDIQENTEETAEKPQRSVNGLLRGMYCEACGYMEVNTESDELPLEGFAMCPNCGAPLKTGWFSHDEDGFHLVENADKLLSVSVKSETAVSGGHYRVRKPGPARVRKKVSHHC